MFPNFLSPYVSLGMDFNLGPACCSDFLCMAPHDGDDKDVQRSSLMYISQPINFHSDTNV